MSQQGSTSLSFENDVFILNNASIVGEKEGDGPYGDYFDRIETDPFFGEDTWEKAESKLQQDTAFLALEKQGLVPNDIRYVFAGDLLGQEIATGFGMATLGRPIFGLYSACSTIGEALSLGAMTVNAGYAEKVLSLASSHFCSAEKQFRFPLEYGHQVPPSSTRTVTGCGAFILSNTKGKVKITGITTGVIMDYGIKDAMNMGAVMAPSASNTITRNLKDFHRQPSDYDKIITGDLGVVGSHLLLDLLNQEGIDISAQHMDCGVKIFDDTTQNTNSGGSGCGCSASFLSAAIIPKLQYGEWRRVLFVPTGALLSPVSSNEGQSIPSIAHGVVLEAV